MIIGLFCCDVWFLLTLGRTSERLENSLVHAARRAKSFKRRRRRRLLGLRVPIPQRESARSGLSRALSLPPPPLTPPPTSHTHTFSLFLAFSRSLSHSLSLPPRSLTHSHICRSREAWVALPDELPSKKEKKEKKEQSGAQNPLRIPPFAAMTAAEVHIFTYMFLFLILSLFIFIFYFNFFPLLCRHDCRRNVYFFQQLFFVLKCFPPPCAPPFAMTAAVVKLCMRVYVMCVYECVCPCA